MVLRGERLAWPRAAARKHVRDDRVLKIGSKVLRISCNGDDEASSFVSGHGIGGIADASGLDERKELDGGLNSSGRRAGHGGSAKGPSDALVFDEA